MYEFVVDGEPVPWAVYTRRGKPSPGFESMKAWQAQIQTTVLQKYGRPLLTRPVQMDVTFFRTLPGPAPKSHATWLRRCWKQVGKRPDRTNILKAFEDGLNGILFTDDAIVVSGSTKKSFARPQEKPRTWCKVTPLYPEWAEGDSW